MRLTRHVTGSTSAEALLRMGLTRDEVVRGLIREIGISEPEAECAWDYATAKAAAGHRLRSSAA